MSVAKMRRSQAAATTMLPDSITDLIAALAKLPGVGPRSAERIAFYLLKSEQKDAFALADGRCVEGVHMPYPGRTTLCLSSQVGCAMGCTFCATGAMGIMQVMPKRECSGVLVTSAIPNPT